MGLPFSSHPLTPSHAYTFPERKATPAREGETFFSKYRFYKGAPPPSPHKGALSSNLLQKGFQRGSASSPFEMRCIE